MAATTDFSHLQDVLGQMLMLRTYTQLCLSFTVENEGGFANIITGLREGLVRLADNFPWLAGQVVIEGKNDNCTGLALIIPSDEEIILKINDLRGDSDFPTMSALKQAKFPFRLLDRSKIAEAPAIGESFDGTVNGPVRVLILQLNLIQGGILLNVAGIHHVMDMNGLGQIIYLFAKACRNEPFTNEELLSGNRSRNEVIPLLEGEFKSIPELDHYIAKVKPVKEEQPQTAENPAVNWVYFDFDADSLRRLKKKAATQKVVQYISTDDALSALMWQSIIRARSCRLPDIGKSMLFRSIDGRRLFNLDKNYLGHMVTGFYMLEADVPALHLDTLAGQMRARLKDTSSIRYATQVLTTLLDRAADKTMVGYVPNVDVVRDVLLSSWAKAPCYNCDFGILGKADFVRRARLAPFDGLVYFMPKSREGSIAAAICLRDDDIESLRQDDVFMSYATYIG